MAQTLTQPGPLTRGASEKYPWAQWLDGTRRELLRGRDFDCDERSFQSVANAAGRRHGVKVTTARSEAGVLVEAVR
jgi:hypothetical protein